MPCPFDFLGLGFSGYVEINGKPLPLDPSQNSALDNLIKSQANSNSSIPFAEGDIPVRDRRSLSLSLTVPMCAQALRCYDDVMFAWRRLGAFSLQTSVKAIIASGEGFETSSAYITGGSLSIPQEGMGVVTFDITCYKWENLTGTEGPERTSLATPVLTDDNYQPIPHWAVGLTHSGQEGTCQSMDFATDQRYTFGQLCEATIRPPTPAIATGGPLTLTLNYVTIAKAGIRPAESGSVFFDIGGRLIAGNQVPGITLEVPFMYRDPQYAFTGWGSQNELVRLSAGWSILGQTPTLA